eukprot:scaffold4886_cov123-Isochrysis_galbana.AAC.9
MRSRFWPRRHASRSRPRIEEKWGWACSPVLTTCCRGWANPVTHGCRPWGQRRSAEWDSACDGTLDCWPAGEMEAAPRPSVRGCALSQPAALGQRSESPCSCPWVRRGAPFWHRDSTLGRDSTLRGGFTSRLPPLCFRWCGALTFALVWRSMFVRRGAALGFRFRAAAAAARLETCAENLSRLSSPAAAPPAAARGSCSTSRPPLRGVAGIRPRATATPAASSRVSSTLAAPMHDTKTSRCASDGCGGGCEDGCDDGCAAGCEGGCEGSCEETDTSARKTVGVVYRRTRRWRPA